MGYKAQIKALEAYNDHLKKRNDALFAAIKRIIMEKGDTDETSWKIQVPEFNVDETNLSYSLTTEPMDGYYIMTVDRTEAQHDAETD